MTGTKSELEKFLDLNSRKLVWFATSAGLFKGIIVFRLTTEKDNIVELQDCTYLSANNSPHIEKFSIRFDEIFAWGIAE